MKKSDTVSGAANNAISQFSWNMSLPVTMLINPAPFFQLCYRPIPQLEISSDTARHIT
ncbi:hypothetical protein GJ744_004430 [Endocarpon pusillum]|uniref:Uncharacterized protein n=1 Tax=Endocarpon pusillum TaxID=364733 RepID=A0A8H7EA25_9EURO|nr:hypothetical protein GJ744_004430 [Endocarpon pusillum]